MSSGLVNRQKGIDVLIEAAALLKASGDGSFVVDIYGRVADTSLGTLIQQRGLAGHVTLRGPRPHSELTKLYADYDLFAFPTREREPFGIVPLEAMAAGCVPVITRRCGVGEWLVHGVHCLKATRSAEDFATVLRDVATGAIDVAPVARRGAAVAWREFHLDAILPQIEAVLSEAIGERPARNPRRGHADVYRLARLGEFVAQDLVRQSRLA